MTRYIFLLTNVSGWLDAEDHIATGPDLRIGDADREAVAASLRDNYEQGRLTLDEFNQRLDAVFKATTQRQLNQLTWDLPHASRPSAPLPVAGQAAIPAKWPGDRYDVIWSFTRVPDESPARYTFGQIPQLLLAGDTETVIPAH